MRVDDIHPRWKSSRTDISLGDKLFLSGSSNITNARFNVNIREFLETASSLCNTYERDGLFVSARVKAN